MELSTNIIKGHDVGSPDDQVKDLIDLLNLAIKRSKDKLLQLDSPQLNASERKELLNDIARHIQKANQNITNIQYEIKVLPRAGQQAEYSQQLNVLRGTVNEHELNFNEKKKKFKHEIHLDQEKQMLDYIDHEEINAEMSGLGDRFSNEQQSMQITQFLKSSEQPFEKNKKGGWFTRDSVSRRGSNQTIQGRVGNKPLTEKDLAKLSKEQLRKNKE